MSTNGGELTRGAERIIPMDIEEEMRSSYLTYAMSVIISRALPDVRDGLKPSQRRILVAMNDLNLGPNAARVKCAKISGDTSGNYHPHGDGSIYPTLVRMAQDWVMRYPLIDKQGNFGSLAGLPAAAMRYTEARLSAVAAEMLRDLDHDTVDFTPTYDQRTVEPVVLPSRFPNLLANGSVGIAVGMRTEIPPHNLGEICDAVTLVLDDPGVSFDELLDVLPGPDFPTGGIVCGRLSIRRAYMTGRGTITLRARTHFETEKNSDVIVVTEIPYGQTRDGIRENLEMLVREDKVKGISRIVDLTDRNVPPWQVRLHIVLKRDADRDVVLNQLFKHSRLQTTISVILLALVGNRPQLMSIRELIDQFIRHRITVIRRRTEYLLNEARKRKHTVEGLLIAQVDIDQVIRTIRESPSRTAARDRLQQMQVPAELIARALGEEGFRSFQDEYGVRETYSLSRNQAEAIVSMQLGSLANLEREQLGGEYRKLLEAICEYLRLLSDEANIRAVIREDMADLKKKYADARRTDISDEELTDIDREDLITEAPMVVTISQRGYIKRTPLDTYQAQNRGGTGIIGAKTDDEDPITHLFVTSTHDYLLFFTNLGRVYWQKVYDIPQQDRTARGRAIVNLLSLQDGEQVANCISVREFADDRFLMFATRNGLVKKTALSAYSRPRSGGIIAINLDEGDSVVDVQVVEPGDDVLLETANGMAIRFSESDVRSMGRNTRGVRGIKLRDGDHVVGMVVADPKRDLLTVCANGYGKRTPLRLPDEQEAEDETEEAEEMREDAADESDGDGTTGRGSSYWYRRQGRGGLGIRDIRTNERNGPVVDIVTVTDEDDVLMVTAGGKIQRVPARQISVMGRNTQGVRIMRLHEGDTIASVACVPADFLAGFGIQRDETTSERPSASGDGQSDSGEHAAQAADTPSDAEASQDAPPDTADDAASGNGDAS